MEEWLSLWGRVTHVWVSKLTIIGSDNGLSLGRHQAIIWTDAGMLLIGPLGKKFSESLIELYVFPFKKMHFKMSSGKWLPFCLGLNVLYIPLYHVNVIISPCPYPIHALTHWGRGKMAAIFQTTFSTSFSWLKMYEFWLRFHWKLFPRVQLTIFHHWFR